MPSPPRLLLLGAGLSGGLLALALAEAGAQVELAGGSLSSSATGCSYGGVPWWAGPVGDFGDLMAAAPQRWQSLQQRHGDLGLREAELWLHWPGAAPLQAVRGAQQALAAMPRLQRIHTLSAQEAFRGEPLLAGADLGGVVQLPYLRVDPSALHQGLERAWSNAAVVRREPLTPIELQQRLQADEQVVLCSGAATLAVLGALGLPLPAALGFTWAGVWQLESATLARERILMPLLGQRNSRETAASGAAVICDHGLAPAPGGRGILIGQSSWFDRPITAKPPASAESELLNAVAVQLLPGLPAEQLAQVRLHQQPVAYSRDQRPLLGPLPGIPNLSLFTGFGGPFALVPALAPVMADALLSGDWQRLSSLELLSR